jgi:hypothetical protein
MYLNVEEVRKAGFWYEKELLQELLERTNGNEDCAMRAFADAVMVDEHNPVEELKKGPYSTIIKVLDPNNDGWEEFGVDTLLLGE